MFNLLKKNNSTYTCFILVIQHFIDKNIIIFLFKLHITPIWVKQLQYKSMQTYKRKTTQT